MDTALLVENLILPITLAFLLGILATLIRSDLEISEPVIRIFAIFLLFLIGLQGGRELAVSDLSNLGPALITTAVLVVVLPGVAFLVALFYGRLALSRGRSGSGVPLPAILMETLRGRGLLLLVGGLVIGAAVGEVGYNKISPFFVDLFRGVLVLFILEMGMTAARQLREFMVVGPKMLVFGLAMPMVNGFIGCGLATYAGLPLGSAFVIGAVAASASYIDAPAAVRATFPKANPSIYLTTSLGVTFPFMLILGVPAVYQMALFWQSVLG